MTHTILGLHHVTATVNQAQPDVDFCVGVLGLRLVKKTVNFDNHHVYHFYYGTERGMPGTIWTTFPYHGHGVRAGTRGAGQVTVTSFSIPAASVDEWRARLSAHPSAVSRVTQRFGDQIIELIDPSGLAMELVANDRDARPPWIGAAIDPAHAIRGLHGVTMTLRSPGPTIELMTSGLGFRIVAEETGRTRLAAGGDAPGHFAEIRHDLHAPSAVNGLGTVHHVAYAIGSPEEQLAVRDDLLSRGLRVTEVRDRQYFLSIYFREPGGVLFEVATVKPGFLVDEPLEKLGRSLKLPPWEEPNRPDIELGLAALREP